MITVEQATRLISSFRGKPSVMSVSLREATGYVLQEDLLADRDMPPFDRAMMDGIAIQYEKFAQGQRSFIVDGIQAAGYPPVDIRSAENCIEIMTGAVVPEAMDTVIRYEDINIVDGMSTIRVNAIKKGQNIHRRGYDRRSGDLLVTSGTRIGAAETGIAAAIGRTHLTVSAPPKTCIISTGDELTDIHELPLPHQIRKSNVYSIDALLKGHLVDSELRHFSDDPTDIRQGLKEILGCYDVVILSGGVSAGRYDHIPGLLKEMNVTEVFYKIEQRPGKPFWFGTHGDQTAFFALPGNPVSSFLGTVRYILPWISAFTGGSVEDTHGILAQEVTFKPALTYFLPVRHTISSEGLNLCTPVPGHGSGDFANLAAADGFLELPLQREVFNKGESFPLWRYR